jgi:hypothetical protein
MKCLFSNTSSGALSAILVVALDVSVELTAETFPENAGL